ncbi:hypothetical protein [Thermoactinospora rubra]|uniref:hypothetical protein n=1 Tax=Thermoactinospora rubra TaxID=1088767 RepID=UPI000A103AF6|nr:hypothetical protein [Thermoactinospora rubra]
MTAALVLLAVLTIVLSATRTTRGALTAAEMWHLAHAAGWRTLTYAAAGLCAVAALALGAGLAALLDLAVELGMRAAVCLWLICAAVCWHVRSLRGEVTLIPRTVAA